MVGKLPLDPFRIRVRKIHLVDRHNDRNPCSLGVVDGLHGLRLDAFHRGNHQNHDVRNLGSACPKSGKRLVSRGINKRDLMTFMKHPGCPNVLGNFSVFPSRNIGLPDVVQKRGLPMVYMSHDRHHRRARLRKLHFFLNDLLLNLLCGHGKAKAFGKHSDRFQIQGLVD